jgi:hypothetical protein
MEPCEDADRSDDSGRRYDEPGHGIGDNIFWFDASFSWRFHTKTPKLIGGGGYF